MSKRFKLTEAEVATLTESLDYKHEVIVKDIKEYIEKSGAKGIVLGVSSGIDSALTMTLCVEALGCDNVLGLMMPYSDALHNKNTEEAQTLCYNMGVRYKTVPIGDSVDALAETLRWGDYVERETSYSFDKEKHERIPMGNIMARVRMIVLYDYAWKNNYLVAGTSNKPELFTGYFTKWGDGAADFEAIAELLKVEVRELSKELGIPQNIIDKAPSADLYEGQTDEDQLGFSYDELDYMIHYRYYRGIDILKYEGQYPNSYEFLAKVLERVTRERFEKLDKVYATTQHKRSLIPIMGILTHPNYSSGHRNI